jgi:hypothetical protein
MPIVSMDAAISPATSIFQGRTGTIPAVMRMIGPLQVIIGSTDVGTNQGRAQWISTPIANVIATM